jgi:hypothetical protein
MRLEIDITRVEIKILFIACIAKPKTKDLNDRSKKYRQIVPADDKKVGKEW